MMPRMTTILAWSWLGILSVLVIAGPTAAGGHSGGQRWSETYVLKQEASETSEDVVERRIPVPSLLSEEWTIDKISQVETWSWECNCYRLIPSAAIKDVRVERDEHQATKALVITIRPNTVCSPTRPECWRAPWQIDLTLSGNTK